MRRIPSLIGFLLPLAFYFALATPQLDLPGLHNDEAVEAGLQASQILNGQPIFAFREAGITIADRTYPLMVQDYIGAFNVYFALPFFAVLGSTVTALRFYTVCIGAVTIALTYGFLATTVNKRAAFVAAMLLAVSPSFIFWQRQGVYVASLTATFAVACLWVAVWWARSPNPISAYKRAALLGLLCGLGLYAKLLFIWIIGGMVGAGVILILPDIFKTLVKRQAQPAKDTRTSKLSNGIQSPISNLQSLLSNLFSFSAALFLALLPLFAYNLQTGGTFLSVGTNLTTSYYGVNNLDFASNFTARMDHFQAVIAGRDHLWYLGGSFGNGMWGSALSLVSLVIIGRWLFRRQRTALPMFILLVLGLGLIQSSFTVSGLFPTHLSIFMPLPAILIALTAETILDPFHEPMFIHVTGPNLGAMLGGLVSGGLAFLNIGMIVVAVGLASLWGNDLVVTGQYHVVLNQTGGLGPHSDAVYRLIDTLQENADAPIIAMDWGFAPQVRMLTAEAIQPQEVFGYTWEPDEGFADRLNAALDQPDALFVFHFPQETIFPRREQFDAALAARGWATDTVAIISRRDGAPVFEIIRVREP